MDDVAVQIMSAVETWCSRVVVVVGEVVGVVVVVGG